MGFHLGAREEEVSLRTFLEEENENWDIMGVRREKPLQVTPHFRLGRGQPPRTRWFVGRIVSSGWGDVP